MSSTDLHGADSKGYFSIVSLMSGWHPMLPVGFFKYREAHSYKKSQPMNTKPPSFVARGWENALL